MVKLIRVGDDVYSALAGMKLIQRESFSDVISRLIISRGIHINKIEEVKEVKEIIEEKQCNDEVHIEDSPKEVL